MTRALIVLSLMAGCSSSTSNRGGDGAAAPDVATPFDATSDVDARPAGDADLSDGPVDRGDGDGDGAADGDGGYGNPCRPACIEKVFGACAIPATGTCVNTGALVCFSNGVKLSTALLDGGANEPFARVTLFKPDGTTCGSYTNAVGADGNVYLVYYDPSGVEVGRQQRVVPDAASGDLLYTCDGQTYTVTSAQLGAPECQHLQLRDCPMGTCS